MKLLFFALLTLFCLSTATAYSMQTEYDDDVDDLPYVRIQYVSDFSQLAETASAEEKIIMLEVSASYCEYCDLLEEEFIKPMLRNDDYSANVLIRKIDIDGYQTLIDFSGNKISSTVFARHHNVKLTPTILFFDGNGIEITQRILGINSIELYGGYIDDALSKGLEKIRAQ